MPSSRRTTGRGGGGGGGGGAGADGGGGDEQVPPFMGNNRDHNPRELRSWARRTGFHSSFFSGESNSSFASSAAPQPPPPPPPASSRRPPRPRPPPGRDPDPDTEEDRDPAPPLDLERGGRGRRRSLGDRQRRRIDLRGELEIPPGFGGGGGEAVGSAEPDAARGGARGDARRRNGVEREAANVGRNVNGVHADAEARKKAEEAEAKRKAEEAEARRKKEEERDAELAAYYQEQWANEEEGAADGAAGEIAPLYGASGLRCGVTENPGWVPLIFYGIQHYLSIAGSLVFVPLILVPTMGGSDEDTATVISTMLLVSGLTTILHTFLGSRLPLVQGSSFVYLAPALVIANSEEFRNLSENKFKHIMRELQGAILVGSVFQIILGYTGLMSLFLRLINPVVVAPTIAVVGLTFFSYGFPQAGSCVEISMPLIVLVLLCTLYMRKISLFGNHIFLVYAVPLSVAIVWAYAFFLTAGGAYNFKGCSSNIPSSNILLDSCRRHLETMRRCRTDVSTAWRTAAWVRVPYPFQWGAPTFHFKTGIIMVIVSLVASVDSLATYHAASLLVNLSPPTRGVVSRGIGLEGISTFIAGLWGTGTGSTTLTENIHTLETTKMASRRALQLGAALLVFFSFFGKIGALLASIPVALAASVLCFTWALIVALGLSTLRYTQAASSRNMIIVGFTLFISLSIPSYFQQYEPSSTLILPSYLLPYAAGSSGPVRTGSSGLNYAVNALLSINVVVALLVALILDNTVPGSKQERGVYIWSDPSSLDVDPATLEPYRLPEKISCWFRWAKCVGI
ncbi:nucleobase-ascorbate transporter 11-like [Phragmites australis]|uniref:nucleobase-ascorbate transporter 11-like n=1 Tax=Phragmites australis TaxID=29695 RepID=UPI002D787C83|nr:nucleobase-ascorbate transporter 11-like [Phragmites australis]